MGYVHVTTIRHGGIYGHDCSDVAEEDDCGGLYERYYGPAPEGLEPGCYWHDDGKWSPIAE